MVLGFNITPIEHRIIDRICDLQIESFCRLASGKTQIDVELRRIGAQVSKQDVAYQLVSDIEIYEDIKSDKSKFVLLDAAEMNHIKEMILNFAEEFRQEFSADQVSNFWHKISLTTFAHAHLN